MLQKLLIATMGCALITAASGALAQGHNWSGLYLGIGSGSGGASGTVSGCQPAPFATPTETAGDSHVRILSVSGMLSNCGPAPTATPSPTPSPTPTPEDDGIARPTGPHALSAHYPRTIAPGLRRLFNGGASRQPLSLIRPLATLLGGGFTVGTSNYGMAGGGLAGFNFQTGNVVWGPETEVFSTWSSSYGSSTNGISQDWGARLRVRLGITSGDWLFYGAGGYSQANFTLGLSSAGHTSMNSMTVGGYNGGVGVEYALGNAGNARIEYIHDWYNAVTFVPTDSYFPPETFSNLSGNTVRAAFSWSL